MKFTELNICFNKNINNRTVFINLFLKIERLLNSQRYRNPQLVTLLIVSYVEIHNTVGNVRTHIHCSSVPPWFNLNVISWNVLG